MTDSPYRTPGVQAPETWSNRDILMYELRQAIARIDDQIRHVLSGAQYSNIVQQELLTMLNDHKKDYLSRMERLLDVPHQYHDSLLHK